MLYASEFWRRFRNDQWRQRTFPDGSPFKKLEWLHFLSLVGWEYLYRKRSAVKGYIEVAVEDRLYRIWHTNQVPANGDEQHPDSVPDKRGYPGLYFPMLAAWQWWNVAPLTSTDVNSIPRHVCTPRRRRGPTGLGVQVGRQDSIQANLRTRETARRLRSGSAVAVKGCLAARGRPSGTQYNPCVWRPDVTVR